MKAVMDPKDLAPNDPYLKSTLLACLRHLKNTENIETVTTYRGILRREAQGIKLYTQTYRDPTNDWRIYTGDQIKKIIAYERESN